MPINIGIQFVPRDRYNSAITFLQDVLAIYPFNSTFTAGQVCQCPTFASASAVIKTLELVGMHQSNMPALGVTVAAPKLSRSSALGSGMCKTHEVAIQEQHLYLFYMVFMGCCGLMVANLGGIVPSKIVRTILECYLWHST